MVSYFLPMRFHKKELQSKAVLNGWKRWVSMSNYFARKELGVIHLFHNCEKMFFFSIRWNLIIPDLQRYLMICLLHLFCPQKGDLKKVHFWGATNPRI